jgi:lipoprotein-releasing system permease protein
MYLNFAWRYFKAKKSANAINIIAWVTTGVIAFATCCQILVLSVFNGFEDLVKSMYSNFYSDIKISPATGKTIMLDAATLSQLKQNSSIDHYSLIAEEKALIQNGAYQSVVQLKGVDNNFTSVCNLPSKIISGTFNTGTKESPLLVLGSGVQYASGISLNPAFGPETLTVILPKSNVVSNDPLASLSEGNATASGAFSIQQDFDNSYAITNIDFVKQQTGMWKNEFSAVEIKLKPSVDETIAINAIKKIIGKNGIVKNRMQQNASLYNTMKIEKWAIYSVLTLILIIAAFNMISALTMLVLEKKTDISILKSMGASENQVRKIFLSEGMLLGGIGSAIGIGMAYIICILQLKFKLIGLQGGSFIIDYFPVKMIGQDFFLVVTTAMFIVILASWFPAGKAAKQSLK